MVTWVRLNGFARIRVQFSLCFISSAIMSENFISGPDLLGLDSKDMVGVAGGVIGLMSKSTGAQGELKQLGV